MAFQRPNPNDPAANGNQPAFLPPGAFVPNPQAQQFAPNPFVLASPNSPRSHGPRMLPTILELVNAFKRRWVLCVLIGGLLGAIAAVGVWLALPSGKHQAQATMRFMANSEGSVKSIDTEDFTRQIKAFEKEMKTKQFALLVAQQPEIKDLPMIAGAEDKGALIQDLIKVKPEESGEHMVVTINGNEADQIQKILQTYITKFMEVAQKKETDTRSNRIKFLKEGIKQNQQNIEEENKKIRETLEKYNITTGVDNPVTLGLIEADLQSRNRTLIEYKTQRDERLVERDQLRDMIKDGTQLPVNQLDLQYLVDANPVVAQKRLDLAAAQKSLDTAKLKYESSSSRIEEAKKTVEAATAQLGKAIRDVEEQNKSLLQEKSRETQQVTLSLKEKELARTEGIIKLNKDAVDNLTTTKQQIKLVKNDVTDQTSQKEGYIEQRRDLQKKLSELELEKANANNSRISIVEGAQLYLDYNFKTKLSAAVISGLLGLLGVSLVISYLEWRNRRVDGVSQVVQELQMRVIGTIPAFPSRAALKNSEASQNQNWRFILNESVNSTRTMLLHTARTQQMQVILVTSAMQGEGKTSLSSQLATSMATAGLRTLILDCDLRNPSMQKLFDIPVAPGCAEILLQEIDISDAVQTTSVPNLWIIPAGQCNHRVIAALAQGHPLEALFNRLRGQFDIIIVDSCPILPVADTLLVAQHVDGVIFSILQDVSQLPKVQDASDRLVQLNIPLVGAVVNGIKPDVQAYGYNYVKQLPA